MNNDDERDHAEEAANAALATEEPDFDAMKMAHMLCKTVEPWNNHLASGVIENDDDLICHHELNAIANVMEAGRRYIQQEIRADIQAGNIERVLQMLQVETAARVMTTRIKELCEARVRFVRVPF